MTLVRDPPLNHGSESGDLGKDDRDDTVSRKQSAQVK